MAGLKVTRLGDKSDHGGIIISCSEDTFVNGIGVCRQDDLHDCPIPGHGVTKMTHVTATVVWLVNSRPGINENDTAECGAKMNTGSPDTFIE